MHARLLHGALLAALAAACSEPRETTTTSGAGAGGAGGSQLAGAGASQPSSASSASGPDAGSGGLCPPPGPATHPEAPEGWVRPPCVSDACNVAFAPDPSLARPASPWAECGAGCLELVHDWGDRSLSFHAAHGASDGKERYLAYTRLVGDKTVEYQLVRLSDNRVLVNALMFDGMGGCKVYNHGLDPGRALLHMFEKVHKDQPTDLLYDEFVFAAPTSGAFPTPMFREQSRFSSLSHVPAASYWFRGNDSRTWYQWRPNEPGTTVEDLWKSSHPDESALKMSVQGDTVFISRSKLRSAYEVLAWDPVNKLRPLLPRPDAQKGGAYCLDSDGEQMVWLEGSGEFTSTPGPDGPFPERYAETWFMTSPHATESAGVQPRKLRKSFSDFVGGGCTGVLGGGYAVHIEQKYGEQIGEFVVTRLSDGAYWVLPHRPKFFWGEALYVDAEELALVEYASPEVAKEVGLYPGGWTIVRKKIASLGEPTGIGAQP